MSGSKTGLSKSTFTAERHKKVLTQVKKSDVRTSKTEEIKNQYERFAQRHISVKEGF
jgi:hypothetical protein